MWKGPEFDLMDWSESAQLNESQFVQKCIEQYWGAENVGSLNIKIVNEDPETPSEAFQHFFDC